jgi:hypothetical protein
MLRANRITSATQAKAIAVTYPHHESFTTILLLPYIGISENLSNAPSAESDNWENKFSEGSDEFVIGDMLVNELVDGKTSVNVIQYDLTNETEGPKNVRENCFVKEKLAEDEMSEVAENCSVDIIFILVLLNPELMESPSLNLR